MWFQEEFIFLKKVVHVLGICQFSGFLHNWCPISLKEAKMSWKSKQGLLYMRVECSIWLQLPCIEFFRGYCVFLDRSKFLSNKSFCSSLGICSIFKFVLRNKLRTPIHGAKINNIKRKNHRKIQNNEMVNILYNIEISCENIGFIPHVKFGYRSNPSCDDITSER